MKEAKMNDDLSDSDPTKPAAQAGAIVVGVFGFAFLGIGLTVLYFMWSQPFGDFHSPPLFFRIFASFIAICFVAMGGGTAYAALTGSSQLGRLQDAAHKLKARGGNQRPAVGQQGYVCPQCAAPLGDQADVSPHGDAKCPFCKTWFNVHGRE